jgi:hypothetical protein
MQSDEVNAIILEGKNSAVKLLHLNLLMKSAGWHELINTGFYNDFVLTAIDKSVDNSKTSAIDELRTVGIFRKFVEDYRVSLEISVANAETIKQENFNTGDTYG